MVSLSASTRLPKLRIQKSLACDFALLGLQSSEARVDVIRSAAEETASKVPDNLETGERSAMLAELTASTYRLLDPRRRRRFLERVQLCLSSENDPTPVTVGRNPLVAAPAPSASVTVAKRDLAMVIAEIIDRPKPPSAPLQLASKVSSDSLSDSHGKLRRISSRNTRVGVAYTSALATLVASAALVAWLILG